MMLDVPRIGLQCHGGLTACVSTIVVPGVLVRARFRAEFRTYPVHCATDSIH